jgi:hypothetical protein
MGYISKSKEGLLSWNTLKNSELLRLVLLPQKGQKMVKTGLWDNFKIRLRIWCQKVQNQYYLIFIFFYWIY